VALILIGIVTHPSGRGLTIGWRCRGRRRGEAPRIEARALRIVVAAVFVVFRSVGLWALVDSMTATTPNRTQDLTRPRRARP